MSFSIFRYSDELPANLGRWMKFSTYTPEFTSINVSSI